MVLKQTDHHHLHHRLQHYLMSLKHNMDIICVAIILIRRLVGTIYTVVFSILVFHKHERQFSLLLNVCGEKMFITFLFYFFSLSVSYDLPCDCCSIQVRSEINSSDKMTSGGGCGAVGQLVKHNIIYTAL